jgi:hypothetical protein
MTSMRILSFILEEVVLRKLYVHEIGRFMPILVIKRWSLSRDRLSVSLGAGSTMYK